MSYQVVKRYGHEEGWSCTFRQWRADHSHCKYIHGYPLAFELTFECESLDDRNWVLDFGSLKPLKAWLQNNFDHKMLVANDDPQIDLFTTMASGPDAIADVIYIDHVGCEMFAKMTYEQADVLLEQMGMKPRVWLRQVKVSEHGGNSAVYSPSNSGQEGGY